MVLGQDDLQWKIDVVLVADGRKVKTLPLSVPFPTQQLPVVDILRVYGVDFLVAVDSEASMLHGWRFHLQTAEQVCSMEQIGDKVEVEHVKREAGGAVCFDILYQVLAKFINHPALGREFTREMTRLTVVGPAVSSGVGPVVETYITDIVRRLKQDTQKPSLDALRLETWQLGLHSFMTRKPHNKFGECCFVLV